MAVNNAVTCGVTALPERVGAAIGKVFEEAVFGLLKQRLEKELKQRNLPKSTSVEQLADYFTVIMSGMAVMSKVGVTQKRLFSTIELALGVLPT